MNTGKIQSLHCERMAYVYVRQSTPWQVKENRESTERQYHLHERALQLGWAASHVEIIDEDQGRTGTFAAHRSGFQRLVTEVGLGKVGIVLMLEASRLARNNSDWYRLIEICGLSRTLIGDEYAIYNPREPNDRLLLGVKGTLSEAELFTLRTRLYEGRWNKARKGQLQFPLATGYVRGADGTWELDPDAQVRDRLAYLFDSFRRHEVARRVVRDLKQQALDLPTRVVTREGYGSLLWKTPSLSAVVRILRNPAYAGVYVFGRREYSGDRRSAKTGRVIPHQVPVAQWPVKIEAHHAAYLSWEEYVKNCERLQQNWNREDTQGVAREGSALLQGIAYCGICGRKMTAQYHVQRESRSPTYICQSSFRNGETDTICQTMSSRPVDGAIVEAFLESVSPMSLEVGVRVLEQLEQDLAAQRRQRELQLEQARYEARLAQRQYDVVDPDNRLVASELERRWNEKLERVTHLEQTYAQAEQESEWNLSPEERRAIQELSQNLPQLWGAPSTTNQERKRLLRMAIESVQLDGVSKSGEIDVQIRWRSGVLTNFSVHRTAPGDRSLKTSEEAVAKIHEMAAQYTYDDIADRLNAAGYRTAFGRLFTHMHVGYVCRRDGVAAKRERQPEAKTSSSRKLV
jgi:DNA invertase Pin-like site-specific DNA recombinase